VKLVVDLETAQKRVVSRRVDRVMDRVYSVHVSSAYELQPRDHRVRKRLEARGGPPQTTSSLVPFLLKRKRKRKCF